jgi:hypothetical protein
MWRMPLVWSTEFVLCVLLWRAEQWIHHLQGRPAHQADRSSQKYSRITFCSDHHCAFFLLSNLWQKSILFFGPLQLPTIPRKVFVKTADFSFYFSVLKVLLDPSSTSIDKCKNQKQCICFFLTHIFGKTLKKINIFAKIFAKTNISLNFSVKTRKMVRQNLMSSKILHKNVPFSHMLLTCFLLFG